MAITGGVVVDAQAVPAALFATRLKRFSRAARTMPLAMLAWVIIFATVSISLGVYSGLTYAITGTIAFFSTYGWLLGESILLWRCQFVELPGGRIAGAGAFTRGIGWNAWLSVSYLAHVIIVLALGPAPAGPGGLVVLAVVIVPSADIVLAASSIAFKSYKGLEGLVDAAGIEVPAIIHDAVDDLVVASKVAFSIGIQLLLVLVSTIAFYNPWVPSPFIGIGALTTIISAIVVSRKTASGFSTVARRFLLLGARREPAAVEGK